MKSIFDRQDLINKYHFICNSVLVDNLDLKFAQIWRLGTGKREKVTGESPVRGCMRHYSSVPCCESSNKSLERKRGRQTIRNPLLLRLPISRADLSQPLSYGQAEASDRRSIRKRGGSADEKPLSGLSG
ncbi:MAG TPA: hypothetical protein VM123_19780 [archaeon]|nr:hypothetical protein [archaeon]